MIAVISAPSRARAAICALLSKGSMPVVPYDDCPAFLREAATVSREVALILCIDPFATGALVLLRALKKPDSLGLLGISPTVPILVVADGTSDSFQEELLSLGAIFVQSFGTKGYQNVVPQNIMQQFWSLKNSGTRIN